MSANVTPPVTFYFCRKAILDQHLDGAIGPSLRKFSTVVTGRIKASVTRLSTEPPGSYPQPIHPPHEGLRASSARHCGPRTSQAHRARDETAAFLTPQHPGYDDPKAQFENQGGRHAAVPRADGRNRRVRRRGDDRGRRRAGENPSGLGYPAHQLGLFAVREE